MSKHQVCANCYCGFVGPDSGIGSNLCDTCSVELHGECQGQLTELEAELERLRAELVSIHRAVGTLVSSCIDGQNELHGIKYGGPAKRTLRGIEGTLETIARKAAEAAGEVMFDTMDAEIHKQADEIGEERLGGGRDGN